MLKRLLACASVCALAGSANIITVSIANAAEAKPAQLEEVVVTARKVEENLQSVPVAVTALSDAKLKELVVNNVQDLNKVSPSLQSSSCSGNRNACFNPTIRAQGTTAMTNQPSVAAYFADVPSFSIAYFDLQNLQVLKGPQGTLFGETSTGGAVLIEPKKPGTMSSWLRVGSGTTCGTAPSARWSAMMSRTYLTSIPWLSCR